MTLHELKRIAAAATPGPWEWETSTRLWAQNNGYVIEDGDVDAMVKEDADFVATFNPELVGRLLAVVEAAQEAATNGYWLAEHEAAVPELDATSRGRLQQALAALKS